MIVNSRAAAWQAADELFPTDYMLDPGRSSRAGYPIYFSTADGVYAWISDLQTSLEVNLPDGRSKRITIVEQPPRYSEYQIDDALMVISDAIYEIDDKINSKLAEETGIAEARDQLYAAYSKIKAVIDELYPDSKLIKKYNLI